MSRAGCGTPPGSGCTGAMLAASCAPGRRWYGTRQCRHGECGFQERRLTAPPGDGHANVVRWGSPSYDGREARRPPDRHQGLSPYPSPSFATPRPSLLTRPTNHCSICGGRSNWTGPTAPLATGAAGRRVRPTIPCRRHPTAGDPRAPHHPGPSPHRCSGERACAVSRSRWAFVGSASLPADLDARRAEQRGRRWLVLSYALCPCHLPLVLALIGAGLGGTALAGASRWGVGAVLGTLWVLVLWRGFRQIRRANAIEAGASHTCPSGSCTPRAGRQGPGSTAPSDAMRLAPAEPGGPQR